MRPSRIVWQVIPVIFLTLLWSLPVWGAQAYKIYTLHTYEDLDILCDSYTVQKNDHIWQILRRKGHIAESDFPKFVTILKDFNPHVIDVDKIYPGQELLIPLKQMEPVKGPSDGGERYVTIPMIPDVLYRDRTVRSGDSVSKILMTHLGVGWYQIPEDYLRTFRRLNPRIKDLAKIHPGQTIHVPERTPKEPLQTALALAMDEARAKPTPEREPIGAKTPPSEEEIALLMDVMSKSVVQLGGKLLASGQCYFPVKGGKDLRLDLAAFPVVEMQDGRHLILETWQGLPEDMDMAISAFWKDLMVIPADPRATNAVVVDRVFRALLGDEVKEALRLRAPDGGIQIIVRGGWVFPMDGSTKKDAYKCVTLIEGADEHTSPSIVAYLAQANIEVVDILSTAGEEAAEPSQGQVSEECPTLAIDGSAQEAFVSSFVKALGYSYEPRVPISFDYAGFQVETTTNLVYGGKGLDLVVDFGTFYGETLEAVEGMGIQVLSVGPDEEIMATAMNILTLAGITYTENPVLLAANRQMSKATSLTIPGILMSHVDERALLTTAPLHPKLCEFLRENGISVLQIEHPG